jgi:hypothetical protein
MKKNDDLLLEQAYEQIYNEGIWDSVKGTLSGLKQGAGIAGQNLKNKAITSLGGQATNVPTKSFGQAFAQGQQGSLLKSFTAKANKRIQDFMNDIKSMGVNSVDDLRNTNPDFAQKIDSIQKLSQYLDTVKPGQNEPAPTTPTPATPSAASSPSPTAPTTPVASSPAAPTPAPTHTGGRQAGKPLSMTKNAIYKRNYRAAKRATNQPPTA